MHIHRPRTLFGLHWVLCSFQSNYTCFLKNDHKVTCIIHFFIELLLPIPAGLAGTNRVLCMSQTWRLWQKITSCCWIIPHIQTQSTGGQTRCKPKIALDSEVNTKHLFAKRDRVHYNPGSCSPSTRSPEDSKARRDIRENAACHLL